MTNLLRSIGTDWAGIFWGDRLNKSFAFVTWFLCAFGTGSVAIDWTGVRWIDRLNYSFTLVTNFLGAIGTDWSGILWGYGLNKSFTFVTWFLRTIGTNWSGILWISRLNHSFAFVTWLLSSLFPTDSLTILISCTLIYCSLFFYWRLKPLQSILQRLFKLRLSRVTQITHILITINGNNTLSQIFFIWNRKSLIIGLQLLVLQGKNLYWHKETLPSGPNQDQTNNFFTMFFWKQQHSHSRRC